MKVVCRLGTRTGIHGDWLCGWGVHEEMQTAQKGAMWSGPLFTTRWFVEDSAYPMPSAAVVLDMQANQDMPHSLGPAIYPQFAKRTNTCMQRHENTIVTHDLQQRRSCSGLVHIYLRSSTQFANHLGRAVFADCSGCRRAVH